MGEKGSLASSIVSASGVGEPVLDQNIRYHCPVFCLLNVSKPIHPSFKRLIWSFDKGNYDLLRHKVNSFDWTSLTHDDIDIYAANFTSQLLSFCKDTIPNKLVTIRKSQPPWMHNNIRKLIRKRKRTYDTAKQTNNQTDWNTYKQLRNQALQSIRTARTQHTDNLANKLKDPNITSTDFWKVLKQFSNKSNTTHSIPPLKQNDTYITDDTEKADHLNNFFQSQTLLNDANKELPLIDHNNISTYLSTIHITQEDVSSVLKSLVTGKATGPDKVNSRMLKEIFTEISEPLSHLFNYSMMTCQVPRQWKAANVCAIFKKNDPHEVSNYRPISLLSVISKSLEKIIHKYLFNFLISTNAITSLQSGFVPNDSTVNQLSSLYHTFCQALDEGKEVRVVFCDISKAFDRVWHKGLLHKLESKGVSGPLLKWLSNYLSNRSQRVVINGTQSSCLQLQAGVPQGSILGPLLFIVFINDIVDDIHSGICLFAYDTSLYVVVDDPASASVSLNADIHKIS